MLLTIVSFLAVLGVLVLVHELGHFFAARHAGVKVEEFGVGFPPRAFGIYRDPQTKRFVTVGPKRRHAPATIYSFNWFPLGGFVRIKGEQGEEASAADSFAHQGIGRRVWIISAGVTMNVVAAFALLSAGFAIGLPQVLTDQLPYGAKIASTSVQIVDVRAGLPAAEQGLQMGDTLLSLDGNPVTTLEEVQAYVDAKVNTPVTVQVRRGRDVMTKVMTPRLLAETGRGGIGVQLVSTGIVRFPLPLAVWQGAKTTAGLMVEILRAFGGILVRLVQRQPVDVELSGPVGIAVLSGQVVRMGIRYLLQFTALLSLNLAIINFLPFPALDGGRVLFLLVERFRGRAVSAKLEAVAHNVGFALLMLLVLFITYRDIYKLVAGAAVP
ncbi:MAG: M50 family metallopeptidase [bacterium]|nr:M50 family metallopeptidase [bacterium]